MTAAETDTSLSFVTPTDTPFANVLLYGPPKSGKTVAAASAPGPVVYLNADRPNATRFAHKRFGTKVLEAPVRGLRTLIDAVQLVREDPPGTVVLDPVGDVHRILLEESSGRAVRPKLQDYGDVAVHIERFCRAICDEPCNAVFVCHEVVAKDEEAGVFERLPWTGTTNPALGAKLMSMVDVIGYCGVYEQTDGIHYDAQLIAGRGRRGGDRFGALGTSRALDLSEWFEAIAAAEEVVANEPEPEPVAA